MPADGFKFRNGIKHIINNIDKKEWDKYSTEDWNQQIIEETNSRSPKFNSKIKNHERKSHKSSKEKITKIKKKVS